MLKLTALIFITLFSNSLSAWYYPEHAIIADEALKYLPPQIKKVLARKYRTFAEYNQVEGYQLCHDLSSPFYYKTKKEQKKCIPYSTLAAMAADHSNDVDELKQFLKQSDKTDSIGLQLVRGAQDHWRFVQGRIE